MWANLLPILLGFVLTTVIGGLFASFLQHRSWQYQNAARLREEERQKASDVCQRMTSLVDKRLYRMQRLLWAINGRSNGRITREMLDSRLRDYDEVLLEWNDQLNARLAVVGAYFGKDVRDFLDQVVYEAFSEAGRSLEDLLRRAGNSDASGPVDEGAVDDANAEMVRLNHLAYQLGLTMMVRVREQRIGRSAPGVLGETPLSDTRPR
ncbi:hypothetical protein [Dactylosporangium darangshiense]|uniref:Secreted protein n=1 Tax=Dactylosporangium darangshiense TaxID=579108 RepID=A0ABP8DV34_9ACTN